MTYSESLNLDKSILFLSIESSTSVLNSIASTLKQLTILNSRIITTTLCLVFSLLIIVNFIKLLFSIKS